MFSYFAGRVLGQERELPLLRHHNRELAIADDPGVFHP
jgi:hypothetical protein